MGEEAIGSELSNQGWDIEKLCSAEELETNELPCEDECKPYECCFTLDTCSSSIKDKCSQYGPCRNYFVWQVTHVKQSEEAIGSELSNQGWDIEKLCSAEELETN